MPVLLITPVRSEGVPGRIGDGAGRVSRAFMFICGYGWVETAVEPDVAVAVEVVWGFEAEGV